MLQLEKRCLAVVDASLGGSPGYGGMVLREMRGQCSCGIWTFVLQCVMKHRRIFSWRMQMEQPTMDEQIEKLSSSLKEYDKMTLCEEGQRLREVMRSNLNAALEIRDGKRSG